MLSFSFTLCSNRSAGGLAKYDVGYILFYKEVYIYTYIKRVHSLQRAFKGKDLESLLNYLFDLEKPLYYQL